MKPCLAASVIGTLAALTTAGAAAHYPEPSGAPGPANRIVGLWSTEAAVAPCKPPPGAPSTPGTPIQNTLLFNAGGTVVESPRFPPGGAPNVAGVPGVYQRGLAFGTWSYDPRRRTYFLHLQFDNYVDNRYHGYSTVNREIALTKDGLLGTGPVRSARFTADNKLMGEVCGDAMSTRL